MIHEVRRYVIARPRSGEVVDPSAALRLSWLGAEPADVSISLDGAHTWRPVAHAVGGGEQNTITLPTLEGDADSLRIHLSPSRARLPGAADVSVSLRH